MAQRPRSHDDYRIGIICALASEAAAMVAMLDEVHPRLSKVKAQDDGNYYTLGRIGVHNVVIACLPAGMTGNGPATAVAKSMLHSFPIASGLMVGVGGGVWSKENDVRLGDVVVSHPTGIHGATTWLISFEQVRRQDPLAGDYMAFMACIKEQNVPRLLLPPAPRIEQTNSIATLKAFGFIKERLRGDFYDMHRLVYTVMRNWLIAKDEWEGWNEKALEHIANVSPKPKVTNRELWTTYLPHGEHIASMVMTSGKLENLQCKILDNLALRLSLHRQLIGS